MSGRYEARGIEAEYEPGSRGRVLRNLCGITRVRDIQQAESDALLAVQEWAVERYSVDHRFVAADIRDLHRRWLGGLYAWAGEYRTVNLAKDGLLFAAADQVPQLMAAFERNELAVATPCLGMDRERLLVALARTHGELVLIHPFREGNGRCARLLAWLMALQAGLPPLDFGPLAGRGKRAYFAAIQAVFDADYGPLQACFEAVIRRSLRPYGERV
jgi:cell filamentation protein